MAMFKKIYRTALQTANRITEDEIFVYAAQASFYIITASIPFMMLFLALLKFFIPISEKEAIESVTPFIPTMLQAPVETIISELFAKATAIISITSITAIWSASRGVAAVERGVKKVYKTQPSPNVIKGISFSILYTVLFMIVLLATLLLVVFGGIIYTLLNKHFTWLIALDRVMGAVIHGEMVRVAKPDPEIFLLAAERIGMQPEHCTVIEDSTFGIRAAKAAGMRCLAYTGANVHHLDNSEADARFDAYTEENYDKYFG